MSGIYKFGQVCEVTPTLNIEIQRFEPKSDMKANVDFAVWSPGRRRNYSRVATRVAGNIWKFKFEGYEIDFEMI